MDDLDDEQLYPAGSLREQVVAWLADEWGWDEGEDGALSSTAKGAHALLNWRLEVLEDPGCHRVRMAAHVAVTVPAERCTEVAALLTRMNAAQEGGHYFLLFEDGLYGYMASLELMDAQATARMLENMLVGALSACDEAVPWVMKVAFGGASASQVWQELVAASDLEAEALPDSSEKPQDAAAANVETETPPTSTRRPPGTWLQ